MRWTFRIAWPLTLPLVALACSPASSVGGGSTGDTDASSGESTGSGGSTSSTMPTTTVSATGDTGPGGDTTMGAATDGDTTEGDPGTTTGAVECPATHACVQVAPAGWSGPVAFETGDALATLTGCGGSFPDELLATGVDAAAPVADCDCTCNDGPLDCADVEVATCNPGSNSTLGSVASGCYSVPNNQFALSSGGEWTAGSALTGSCQGIANTTIDPVAFTGGVRACGGPAIADACVGDSECLPRPTAPFSGAVCIFAEGDIECPVGGDFTLRTVYYTDFEDTRACPTCACDTTEEYCDVAGNVSLFEVGACEIGSGVGLLTPDGMCRPMDFNGTPISTPGSFFTQAPTVPVDACDLAEGADVPQGELTQVDPITVCCLP